MAGLDLEYERRKGEHGNVLWFILIAVGLLGILTAVVSRSGSSVDQSGSYEQKSVQVSQLLRYTKNLEAAVQNMKLNNISENDISFENDVTTTDYTNSGCDGAGDQPWPSCLLFDERGAGLVYRNFPGLNDGSDWIFTGDNNVGTTDDPVGTYGTGSGNDLVMLLPNASLSLCKQINNQRGIGVTDTIPTDTGGVETDEFVGTYTGLNVIDGDPTPFELDGQPFGCFIDGTDSVRYFYYVLLAR